MFKLTNFIIPASEIRGIPNAQLRLSVNCYERETAKDSAAEEINIILAHATGFHKEIWEPVVKSLLSDYNRLNIGKIFALDYCNHGDSAVLNEQILPEVVKWRDIAYDVLQVIDYTQVKKPIVGIGHSIGGAAITTAELIRPGTFSCIVGVDPTLTPSFMKITDAHYILKRKDIWPNREVAKTSFLRHGKFSSWDPEVLDIYVECGLRELADGRVTLKCNKLQEYYTFVCDPSSPIETFFQIHKIECPILFLTGENSNLESSEWALLQQTRTQRGEWYQVPGCSHLVTMENPKQVAYGIESFVYKHLVELKDTLTIPNNPSRIDKYASFSLYSKL